MTTYRKCHRSMSTTMTHHHHRSYRCHRQWIINTIDHCQRLWPVSITEHVTVNGNDSYIFTDHITVNVMTDNIIDHINANDNDSSTSSVISLSTTMTRQHHRSYWYQKQWLVNIIDHIIVYDNDHTIDHITVITVNDIDSHISSSTSLSKCILDNHRSHRRIWQWTYRRYTTANAYDLTTSTFRCHLPLTMSV